MLLRDKHIFIVEDNTQNRVVFQMALLLHGARVEFERAGRDAITRLEAARSIDLIILDLMLNGGVSGYEIFEDIRRLPKFDTVPVIAVSAAEASIAIPKTQQMGFAGFIAKPIDDDLFAQQLGKVLEGEQIWYAGV